MEPKVDQEEKMRDKTETKTDNLLSENFWDVS